jgi:hypothetical protein
MYVRDGVVTHSTNELIQNPHTLIPRSQNAFLNRNAPSGDVAVQRPSCNQDEKSGKSAEAEQSAMCS